MARKPKIQRPEGAVRPGPPDKKDKFPDIIERLCSGMSLQEICRQEDMPNISTVLRWVATDEEMRNQYVRAMEIRADLHHEELLSIADDGRNDWMEIHGEDSIGYRINGEAVARSKLRIETRKWSMSRMAAKKYGDAIIHRGDKESPIAAVTTIDLSNLNADQLAALASIRIPTDRE